MKIWIAEMTTSNDADSNTILLGIFSSLDSALEQVILRWPERLNKESFLCYNSYELYVADDSDGSDYIRWEIYPEEMDTMFY